MKSRTKIGAAEINELFMLALQKRYKRIYSRLFSFKDELDGLSIFRKYRDLQERPVSKEFGDLAKLAQASASRTKHLTKHQYLLQVLVEHETIFCLAKKLSLHIPWKLSMYLAAFHLTLKSTATTPSH